MLKCKNYIKILETLLVYDQVKIKEFYGVTNRLQINNIRINDIFADIRNKIVV